ncbi:MAG: ATP synthase F0, A subunit [Candidatus Xenolissoclinum pacificiensis L6]|uniref:ATP synthase subunit a n=1 Tax=Candidatus Xenolissoclinum pacificiensis L6 TaxID=1401685 RepID=W2V0B1_9RICK|nr:MAG: ATP synthase F0, A subunit [Candidatus Xenolissoclinum pacificiensis L6]
MSSDYLGQFEIKTIFQLPAVLGYRLDFTNSSLYMMIATLTISSFLLIGSRRFVLVPGYLQAILENLYFFCFNALEQRIGNNAHKHVPMIMTVFLFILGSNLLGMLTFLPMSFTVTSHISVTLVLSIFVFAYSFIVLVMKRKNHIASFFVPSSVPRLLAPLIFVMELFSYCIRPFSLSIRLSANMVAGHVMMLVVAHLVHSMPVTIFPFGFLFMMLLFVFEVFISCLQAYIFMTLSTVYLADAYEEH